MCAALTEMKTEHFAALLYLLTIWAQKPLGRTNAR
jgi:hypothetical protein